jgi:hypothetical protein
LSALSSESQAAGRDEEAINWVINVVLP